MAETLIEIKRRMQIFHVGQQTACLQLLLLLAFPFNSIQAALLLSKDQAVQNDLVYRNRNGRPI